MADHAIIVNVLTVFSTNMDSFKAENFKFPNKRIQQNVKPNLKPEDKLYRKIEFS